MPSASDRAAAPLREMRCGLIVGGLVLYLLIYPLLIDSLAGRALTNAGLSLLLVGLLWALHGSLREMAFGAALALPANQPLVELLLPGQAWARAFALVVLLVFLAAVTIRLLAYVMNLTVVTADKVFGAVAVYILIAFIFAAAFALLLMAQPDAFAVSPANQLDGLGRIDMIYFSFTVLTSTGFGEITPATRVARSLIILEQTVGVMYVAFLVARLARLYPLPRHRG